MIQDPSSTTLSDLRMFDIAKGVLVATRRCSIDEAFAELVAGAAQHGVGVFAISRALVALTEGSEASPDDGAIMAARASWGELLLKPGSISVSDG